MEFIMVYFKTKVAKKKMLIHIVPHFGYYYVYFTWHRGCAWGVLV